MASPTVEMTTHVPLVKVDTALKSLRSSDFDIPAAVGEMIDNSLEAKANNIKIRLVQGERKVGKNPKPTPVVELIAVSDDGVGMKEDVLHQSLVLGYSTRYNSRKGLGRFGVGATLAGISQAQRIEIYSRDNAGQQYLYSYIDLEEIETGAQEYMPKPQARALPKQFADMMGPGTGTLVVWSKCDRLIQGEDGTVNDLNVVRDELIHWVSRAYRYFLDGGVRIELDNRVIEPHDPLYLMTIPRFSTDPKAEVLVDEQIQWSVPGDPSRTATVRIRMTLLPEDWRRKRGAGGSTFARDRRIHENKGLSITRAQREIFWGLPHRFYPTDHEPVRDIDRWFGIEISFDPELDECFRVRNVKRGAEPVDALRDTLRNLLKGPITAARKRIKKTYTDEENKKKAEERIHQQAEEIGAEVEKTSPKARAAADMNEEARETKIDELATAAAQATHEQGTAAPAASPEDIKHRLKQFPFSIIDMQWPGKEFIEIEHLGTNTVVKLNNGHPFFTKIYSPLLKAAGVLTEPTDDPETQAGPSQEELQRLARIVHVGLDLLIVSYAKAESIDPDPAERYGDLRMQWGMFLYNMVTRLESVA